MALIAPTLRCPGVLKQVHLVTLQKGCLLQTCCVPSIKNTGCPDSFKQKISLHFKIVMPRFKKGCFHHSKTGVSCKRGVSALKAGDIQHLKQGCPSTVNWGYPTLLEQGGLPTKDSRQYPTLLKQGVCQYLKGGTPAL